MAPIVSEIEVGRPAEQVFAYVTDPSRFPEWQDDVVSVRLETPAPLGVGSRFTTTRRIGRTQYSLTQQVTEISLPRRWGVRGLDGPIKAHADVTVEPLDAGRRSRVTFALDFEGPGIGKLLQPAVRRLAAKAAPRSYRNLKEHLERMADGS